MRAVFMLGRAVQLTLGLSLLGACAASTGAPKPSALAKPVAAKPAVKPAKERLLAALRAVERPGPVLEVLGYEALPAEPAALSGAPPGSTASARRHSSESPT